MILLPASVRLFVATTPANMRRSFDGLSNEVRWVWIFCGGEKSWVPGRLRELTARVGASCDESRPSLWLSKEPARCAR
jgi:hypothetical protein